MLRRLLPIALAAGLLAGAGCAPTTATAQAVTAPPASAAAPARSPISEADLREWVTYLASDELRGRRVFTEGFGLASSYIARHLGEWGLVPLGDGGTYLQTVRRHGYRITRNSTVTVEVGGRRRTFRDGEHVEFPADAGAPQTLTFTSLHLAGSLGGDPEPGALVVEPPGLAGASRTPGTRAARAASLARSPGAGAVIAFSPQTIDVTAPGSGPGGRGRGAAAPDLVTVDDLSRPRTPTIVADEVFFEWLFGAASVPLGELRAALERDEPAPVVDWSDLAVTMTIDTGYEVVSTDLTANVVAMLPGTSAAADAHYVLVGAHLDHVGYAASAADPPGRVRAPVAEDGIWNGADDNASGSAALLAIAKALASGPRPRRSTVFVWHAGEEAGLLGSRYMTEFPVVPLERIEAAINIDMVGRNRDDRESEGDTLYVIGADRVSTDLHNLMIAVNESLEAPMRLDFEYNDASDPNSFYTRSDHFSYASRGIPVAFFFTGTHDDYHANTDSADRILFPKLRRVTELIHQLGLRLANLDQPLERDHRGPRSGRGYDGRILD